MYSRRVSPQPKEKFSVRLSKILLVGILNKKINLNIFQSIGGKGWEKCKSIQDAMNLVYRVAQKSLGTALLLLNSIVKGLFYHPIFSYTLTTHRKLLKTYNRLSSFFFCGSTL